MNLKHLTADQDERRIAGGCLMWANFAASLDLDPSHMAHPALQSIVTIATTLTKEGGSVDSTSIVRRMPGNLKENVQTVQALMSEASTLAAAPHHCNRIRAAFFRRQAHAATSRLTHALEAGDDDGVASAMSAAIEAVSGAHNTASGPITLGDAAEAAFAKAEEARISGVPPGIQTSIRSFNETTGGLRDERLYIIAARPSHGKSALAMQFVTDAGKAGKRVLVFSLEMSAESLATREIARLGKVNSQRMDRGQHDPQDNPAIVAAIQKMHAMDIMIDDRPALTAEQIEQACRAHKMKHGLDVIMIDYAQLIRSAQNLTGEQAVSDTVTKIDALKKKFNCPVILLVQPNKACDSRPDRRPTMGDMHGSSIFEKCANVMIVIYRAAQYPDYRDADPGEAEGIIPKNREGTCGVLRWRWDGPSQSFSDANRDYQR